MAPGWDSGPDDLDPDKVCNPATGLRACSDKLKPCQRLPLCFTGGTYGCDDIREACSAITAQQCRSGFDSAEDRFSLRDCLTTAQEGEDCVETFYRCVWGL